MKFYCESKENVLQEVQSTAEGLSQSEAEIQVITGATNEMGFNCLSAR